MKIKTFLISTIFLSCFSLHAENIEVPFYGDYADPSIVKVGDKFYMTHTSHNYYPGLLIWESTDLKKWTPIGRALYDNVGTVWAPEIVYYDNKYYIYFPTDKGGNYVITADTPRGPWSKPQKLSIRGIDPGHISDNKGNRYIYVNDGRYSKLSSDGLKAITEEMPVYDGWIYPSDWAVECFCLESPKLTFKDGYYYMVSAQGGTSGPSTSHMAVVARSKSCTGPWENSPYNPLVHTYSERDRWVSKGHATLFQFDDDWYIVYHAYKNNNRQLGRSTLLEKIEWTDDKWPVVMTNRTDDNKNVYTEYYNTILEDDDFSSKELKWQWAFWGLDSLDDYSLNNGELKIKSENSNIKALLAVAPTENYEISCKIKIDGEVESGITLFYDNNNFAGLGISKDLMYGLVKGKKGWTEIRGSLPSYFKLRVIEHTISLFYSYDGKEWSTYQHGFDVSGYHTNMLSGFLSLKPAIICKGKGNVVIDDFKFKKL